MTATVFELLFAGLLLIGVLNREKLIAWERKFAGVFVLSCHMIVAIARASLKVMRIAIKVAIMVVEGSAENGE